MEESSVKTIIDVNTGIVAAGDENTVLRALAIGSCVVVAAYCSGKKSGALAHVMLPGKSPTDYDRGKTKYAQDAIEAMLMKMDLHGIEWVGIKICLVGGANVLGKPNDNAIGQSNIDSIIMILKEKGLKIEAKAVGGGLKPKKRYI